MTYKLLSALIEELAKHKSQITYETRKAWAACDFSHSEPNIVKSFVLDAGKGVDYLNKNVATPFNTNQPRFVLKFGGVYAHQRPYVSRTAGNAALHKGSKTENCELADLLCLSVLVDSKKTVLATQASFFQAKVVKEDEHPKIDNETQRWLYDFDDKFAYRDDSFWTKTSLKSPDRNLPHWNEQRSYAFQYLLLKKKGSTVDVRLSPWSVEHRHDFAFYLYRLLTFSAGKAYLHSEVPNGGWSSIVNDVLKMGIGKMGGAGRNSPDLDELLDHFNNFRAHDVFSLEHRAEGVPILIAIVQDTQ